MLRLRQAVQHDRRVLVNKSFEDVIVRMMRQVEEQRRKQEELLIEGYKEMAEESLKITKEFEAIEEDFNWEW